jgi:ferredoxin-type protein NapH
VQLTVLGLLVWLAYLGVYAQWRATRAADEQHALTGVRGKVLAAMHRRIDTMDDPQQFLDDNRGTIWSMRIGGLDLTDPLAAAETRSATRSFHGPLWMSALPVVLVTLLLGKVFCSWICPANLLFEIAGKLRSLLRLARLPSAEVKFSRRNKYLLLAVGLLIAAVVGAPLLALIYPPAVVGRLIQALVIGGAVAGALVLLGVIIAVEALISPRWWCRTMCPGGALYGLIGWPRLLRVKLDANRCTTCRKCEPACQPGLNPVVESNGVECDNCGECVRACPEQALRMTVGLPALPGEPSQLDAGCPCRRE